MQISRPELGRHPADGELSIENDAEIMENCP